MSQMAKANKLECFPFQVFEDCHPMDRIIALLINLTFKKYPVTDEL